MEEAHREPLGGVEEVVISSPLSLIPDKLKMKREEEELKEQKEKKEEEEDMVMGKEDLVVRL